MSEREQRTTRVIPPADLVEMLEATLATTPGPRRRSIGRRARRMAMRGVTVVQLFALVFMLMVPLGTSASDSTTATEAAPSEAPAPTADATPEPTAETTPDPTPAPTAVPAPTTEPEPAATTEPEPASTSAPTTEPSAASDPTTEPSAPTETPIDPEPSAPTETPIDPEPSALPSLEPSAMPSGSAPAESPATTVLDPPGPPTIASDQADYPPAATVTLTGENWAPGEQVHIYVNDTVGSSWSRNIDVVASPTGTIVDAFELPTWFVAKYNVVATGAISGTATTTFTDLSVGSYDQCSNDDGDGFASGDTGCRWVNGNLQANNSTYHEGDSTVQRLWLTSFVPGSSHTVSLTYGTTKGAKHAYDFLTTWDWSEDWITLADRCQSIDGCAAAGESTVNMADDPNVSNTIETGLGSASRRFVMRGGTLNAATAPALTSGIYGSGDTETTVTVTFTVDPSGSMCETKGQSTTCAVALFFGAHVARSSAWIPVDGQGGATSIPGSPYHVALAAVDGASAGSRDNQMQAGALGGTIVIIKDADPDGPQDFNFTLTGQPGFSLDDDADPTLPASMSFQVPAGTYSAVELAPPTGWSLFALTCVDPTTNTTLSLATRTASINLGSGETVTCTFTNTLQRGSITIIKDAVPNGPTDFAFSDDIAGCSVGPLDDDADATLSNQVVCSNVVPGAYAVTETDPSPGFDLTGLTCTDANSTTSLATRTASINLEAGESLSCTFVNTQRGSITIIKDAVPNGPTDFAFSDDIAGCSVGPLDDDADATLSNQVVCSNVVPGAYAVTETDPSPGFDLTGLTCTDANSTTSLATRTASINLEAGESLSCTFVNTQRGSITIIKDAVPNGPTDFAFSDDIAGCSVGPLDDDADATLSNQVVCSNVVPGAYAVTETDPSPGFDLTGLTCTDANSTTSLATRTASINLEAGESLSCTFVNTQRGSITIIKDAVPNGPTDFAFSDDIAGCSVGPLDDDADATLSNQVVCSNVVPGAYAVTETDPSPGFDLTGLTCTDANSTTSLATRTASINLEAGESLSCTFVNTQRGSITIIKDAVPNGPTDFAFSDDIAGCSVGPLDDDADATLSNQVVCSNVVPGAYAVTETDPSPGFDLTGLTCTDANSTTSLATRTASINLEAGESLSCTFVNTQRGSITIIKDAVPNGPTDFAFSDDIAGCSVGPLDDDADATLSNQVVCSNVVPGAYAVTETDPSPGFDLTGLTCTDANSTTSLATRTASINLEAGESLSCTFVNTQRGSITIIKDAVPNGPTDFAFSDDIAGCSVGPLDDDADATLSNQVVCSNVVPGAYAVTETDPSPGFDLTGLTCTDANSTTSLATRTASINLEAGESLSCTFVNTQRGSITIIKDAVPNGPTDFAFSDDIAGCSVGPLDDDADATLSNQVVCSNVVPGAYAVTETDPSPGFDLTGLTCTDANSTTSLATRTASINLEAGESLSCTFVNTQRGGVQVIKTQSGVTPPTAATFTFELRTGVTPDAVNPAPPPAPAVIPGDPGTLLETLIANDGNGFTLDFAATLIPGDTYQLCEVQPAVGWTIDFLGYAEYTLSIGGENTRVCIDFTVSAGETKSITVDNVPPPGGDARTIGYWKNWTSCDGHGNQDPVLDTTLALSPDDFDVDGRTGIRIGDLDVDTCAIAVDLLDKREIKNPALVGDGKKKASDPAFNLVAQLLAYRLNILAGSGDLPCANAAAAQAQAHLDALDFNGNTHGPISKSLGQTLNVLARILDEYNNNVLVCGP